MCAIETLLMYTNGTHLS